MEVVLEKIEASFSNHTNVGRNFKVKGRLVRKPTIGDRCTIIQHVGDIVVGYFMTSRVIDILENGEFKTLNSTYKYTVVN